MNTVVKTVLSIIYVICVVLGTVFFFETLVSDNIVRSAKTSGFELLFYYIIAFLISCFVVSLLFFIGYVIYDNATGSNEMFMNHNNSMEKKEDEEESDNMP